MPSIEKHWLSMNGLVNLDWEDCDQKYMTEHNVSHIILKKGFITISVIQASPSLLDLAVGGGHHSVFSVL